MARTRAASFRVAIEGEPVSISCGRGVCWLVYPRGFLSLQLSNGEVVTDPGDDLETMRETLGGDVGEWRDEHGCSWRFSLEPWRSTDGKSYRVMVQFVDSRARSAQGLFSSWPTLRELRAQLARDDGFLRAPDGGYYCPSLEWWTDADPDRLRFQPVFWSKPGMSWWHQQTWRLYDAEVTRRLTRKNGVPPPPQPSIPPSTREG